MTNDQRTIRPPRRQNIAPFPVTNVPLTTKEEREKYYQMLGLLRDIRAEVQNLQVTLHRIIAQETLEDPNVRAQEVRAIVQKNQPVYDYNNGQIGARLNELRMLINTQAMLHDRYGDQIVHIENQWERATYNWPHFKALEIETETATNPPLENGDSPPPSAETPPETSLPTQSDEIIRDAKVVNEHLRLLIYHIGLLTIPARLNQHLEQLRIGQGLDFHSTFEDEIPNFEDRVEILRYLKDRPMAIRNGVIDAAKGMIFHASPDARRRRFSIWLIIAFALFGAGLVIIASEVGTVLENWPVAPGNLSHLMISYIAVIVGGLLHVGVDAIKQARNAQPGQLLAVEDGLLWIHINETGIIVGIVSLWIGYFGWLFIMGTIDWQTAFLIGYSIDSFVDMFLQRFNTSITTQTTVLTNRIGTATVNG